MTQPQNAVTQADDHNKVVSMRNVNKWFGQFHVLRDINLSVDKGERIVVCGPSGSGKSTLIRCLNRLEKHQDGDISVHGIELNNDVKNIDEIRREVGMVFQHFNLFPHLSILENCMLAPIWVRKTPRAEAEEIAMHFLTRVKIPEQARKYPGQLSGGQQQRVAIARALCMQPQLMLFDEPTSALDPLTTLFIEELMESLKKQCTIVIVTHNMQQAARVSDYTAFFHQGKLVEYADSDTLFTMPEKKQTEDYITGRYG